MNRPEHPDFAKLQDAILWMDGEATEGGKTLPEIVEQIDFDLGSIAYAAEQRALRAMRELNGSNDLAAFMTLWMEGMLVGLQVGRKERTRDA